MPDRYGEPRPDHDCRNGWLTGPDADHPRPCLLCKDHFRSKSEPGSAPISERARRAIDQENRNA